VYFATMEENLHVLEITPPKFNIAPENGWLEDYFPFGKAYFHGLSQISGV